MAVEHQRLFFEDLSIGMEARMTRLVTARAVSEFAEISGDHNPVHLDETYASNTPFKKCIAHGMLGAAFISTVFGTMLPGPGAIYVSQTLNFKAPVYHGDEVETVVRLVNLIEGKKRAQFSCSCFVGARTVIEGDAIIMVPSRPVAI
jgi:3-hydroxybutyryl-CoA dehydratase